MVVPVHQDPEALASCLAALRAQDLPYERFEVVVCDNGSSTRRVRREDVKSAAPLNVTLLVTDDAGSYRARNACLRHARGRVLAFTDADCTPQPDWLRRGLEALDAGGVELVAGRVEVYAQHRPPTPTELFELLNAFPQERYVARHGFGVTANLFVRREVFERVGPFAEELLSGGDREFGERARAAGARIAYCVDAVVRHPARVNIAELATKTRRVVRGALDAGHAPPNWRSWLRQAVPPLGAHRRSKAFPNRRDRLAYIGGEVAAHYVRWWAWRAAVTRARADRPSQVPMVPRPVVLTNAVTVRGNPWLGYWLKASAAAGLEVRQLTVASALKRGAASPLGGHLQWPEAYLREDAAARAARMLAVLIAQCLILRLRGKRLLLTVHNTRSHDGKHPRLESVMWWALGRLATDSHLLMGSAEQEVLGELPALRRTRRHVIPHGDYPEQAQLLPDRSAARSRHGLAPEAKLLLSFGFLRAYKGTSDVMRVFAEVPRREYRLHVAGRAWSRDEEALRSMAARDWRISLELGYLHEDRLLEHLAAADLVVLPYRRVLNSGSAMLALSCKRPVLVPSTPTFTELSEKVGPGWVLTYTGDLKSSDIEGALAAQQASSPELRWCSWQPITEQVRLMWNDSSSDH